MSDTVKEYAKALFEIAIESNNEETFEKELDLLMTVFSENPEYVQFLLSPGIPLSERLEAVEKAFSEQVHKDVMSFVKLLCEKRYIKYIDQCVFEYKKLLNEVKRCAFAKVISAIELNEQEKQILKDNLEKMSGKMVVLDCIIDKSILGGLIVELDGKTINASIKGHLKNIKDVIGK